MRTQHEHLSHNMSRLKDLRELICVSRLTYRESDDEVWSDDGGEMCQSFANLRLTNDGEATGEAGGAERGGEERIDSGIVVNGEPSSGPSSSARESGGAMDNSDLESQRTRRRRRKKKRDPSKKQGAEESETTSGKNNNFDEMLCYLDSTIVSEWLLRANEWVNDLSVWCHTGTNYIDLANFMLTDFPDLQRQKILELEYSIFMDELTIAFTAGRRAGQVTYRNLQHLAFAVFREYPSKLLSEKGKVLFLDYLDVLSSEKRDSYRALLSDVRISTQNRQYAQLLLAVRAFGLASLWFAIINFYRKLKVVNAGLTVAVQTPVPSNTELLELTSKDQTLTRLLQAIKCEYIPVIGYFIHTGKVDVGYRDDHKRSLLHIAIMNNREQVLEYLLARTDCAKDVNHRADNGNSPLHAAINNGNQSMVRLLIRKAQADCNLCNPLCDNAAPLHLAIMHGYKTIVALLLEAGADPLAKMGDLDAMDMAEEFKQEEIKELLANR